MFPSDFHFSASASINIDICAKAGELYLQCISLKMLLEAKKHDKEEQF